MTFSQQDLIKIGRLFKGRDSQNDTSEIARMMGCSEADIYNALTKAREAYRLELAWHREHQQLCRDKARACA